MGNAKVGEERACDIVGPYGLGIRNERGEKLIEWCKRENLCTLNTWYKNHPRRLWTWKSPRDCVGNHIDFIMIRKRFRNAVKNSKTAPGADCNSYHVPVVCQISVNLNYKEKE